MPLFDFWRKQSNKKADENEQQRAEQVQSARSAPLQPVQPSKEPGVPKAATFGIKREFLPPGYETPVLQLLLAWIFGTVNISEKDEWAQLRRQRRFLEEHPELLNAKTDDGLREMMAHKAGKAEWVEILQQRLKILQRVRAGGGTVQSIRAVFTDVFGGLVLDVPEWLEEALRRLAQLQQQSTGQIVSERIILLRECITHAQSDPTIPAEVVAELFAILGRALRAQEGISRGETLKEAVAAYEKALRIYTLDEYPERYAEIQNNLGNIYTNLSEWDKREYLEQAAQCYKEVLRVYTPEQFPSTWANVKICLGNALNELGGRHRREAIECYQDVLEIVESDAHPDRWANIQLNLGVVYLEWFEEDRTRNLEQAIQCFTAALRYYNREAHPSTWVKVQANLGLAYLQRLSDDPAMNIERAIRCFQLVLRIATPEAFPREWIFAHEGMGNAYRKRIQGDPAENIEFAIQNLSIALQALDGTPFRAKWLKVHNDLGEAYRKRIVGDRAENLRLAAILHQAVLMRSTSSPSAESQRAQLNAAYIRTLQHD